MMKERVVTGPMLADSLRIPRYKVVRWRSGTAFPTDAECERLAKYFDVPVETVLKLEGTSP